MPFHRIYAPTHLFSAEDKQALARTITAVYTTKSPNPFPPFYVTVCFVNVDEDNFFIGTETHTERARSVAPVVRIVVQHLARHVHDPADRLSTLDRVEAAYREVLEPKGMEWELSIEEPPQDLWRINGVAPPLKGEEDMAAWIEANHSLPRTS